MDKFVKLIVITEQDTTHSITLLAQSIGVVTEQQTKHTLLNAPAIKCGTLLALPYNNVDLSKKGVSAELQHLQHKAPLFLFQAERILVDPVQALNHGIRGVIFRDEQLDRVLTALKTMMDGQLYYSRTVMSELVDHFLQEKRQACIEQAGITDSALLTKQEKRIIQLVAEGARNKEIADNLNISAHTVKAHLSSIFRKTQARNRVELLRWVQQPAYKSHTPLSVRTV